MRVKAFGVNEPLPEFGDVHAIVMLEPWINAGNVGTMTISWMEHLCAAWPLAEMVKPGAFYDFTRYRPMTYFLGQEQHLRLPNTRASCGEADDGTGFVFLRLLEPHMLSDYFVDSVVELLRMLSVKRYCLIGSMYNFVPHTRPPMVSGGASTDALQEKLSELGVASGRYQGPTSMCSLISKTLAKDGVETMSLIVNLPQYTQLEDDYIGTLRIQGILSSLYGLSIPEENINQAEAEREQINAAAAADPQVNEVIEQLEEAYDERQKKLHETTGAPLPPSLSPKVEDFLHEMERRFRRDS